LATEFSNDYRYDLAFSLADGETFIFYQWSMSPDNPSKLMLWQEARAGYRGPIEVLQSWFQDCNVSQIVRTNEFYFLLGDASFFRISCADSDFITHHYFGSRLIFYV